MVLRGLTTGVGAVIMAIIINPTLSIVFIIIAPLIIFLTLYYVKKSFGLYDLVQKNLDNLTLILREKSLGLKVIKALSKEKVEEERFDIKNNELKDQSIEADSLMLSKLPFYNSSYEYRSSSSIVVWRNKSTLWKNASRRDSSFYKLFKYDTICNGMLYPFYLRYIVKQVFLIEESKK